MLDLWSNLDRLDPRAETNYELSQDVVLGTAF